MREILFRGKRTDNGEWVYGWLGHFHCYHPQEKNISSIYFTEITEDFNTISNIIVDYKTVGQYTGLTDRNGKEIFEGDILHGSLPDLANEPDRTGYVNWGEFGWIVIFNKPEWEIARVGFCSFSDYEVIGNIFENPELLEVEE